MKDFFALCKKFKRKKRKMENLSKSEKLIDFKNLFKCFLICLFNKF